MNYEVVINYKFSFIDKMNASLMANKLGLRETAHYKKDKTKIEEYIAADSSIDTSLALVCKLTTVPNKDLSESLVFIQFDDEQQYFNWLASANASLVAFEGLREQMRVKMGFDFTLVQHAPSFLFSKFNDFAACKEYYDSLTALTA